MAKAYNDNADKIRAVLKQQSLRLWKLDDLDWRVDYTLSSSSLEQVSEPAVQLKMTVGSPHGGDPSVTKTAISASKFQLLLHGGWAVTVCCDRVLRPCKLGRPFVGIDAMLCLVSAGGRALRELTELRDVQAPARR